MAPAAIIRSGTSLMEPLTLASKFASIVGLLGVFKSEQRGEESATIDQYVAWLRNHHHEQLANLILDNNELARLIQASIRKMNSSSSTRKTTAPSPHRWSFSKSHDWCCPAVDNSAIGFPLESGMGRPSRSLKIWS